jgi:hypothetical protein
VKELQEMDGVTAGFSCLFASALQECYSNVTTGSTGSESSSKNNSSGHSEQLGAATNMASQLDEGSHDQEQQQHKVLLFISIAAFQQFLNAVAFFLDLLFATASISAAQSYSYTYAMHRLFLIMVSCR